MSRILEFQPADEQTVVARVLLELHQAIDSHFPDAKGTSRQFTKTILSSGAESTAVDNRPNQPQEVGGEVLSNKASKDANRPITSKKDKIGSARSSKGNSSIEFSKVGRGSALSAIGESTFVESRGSIWITRILVASFLTGCVLGAWIYLFGSPF